MRPVVIAGNWKMNKDLNESSELIKALLKGHQKAPGARTKVIVFPPFPSLSAAADLFQGSPIAIGAQNMSEHDVGAYTGVVSWRMLLSVGCEYVIVGHSERRQYHNESDALVNRKAAKALKNGLIPIICVGETLDEREAGKMQSVVAGQVRGICRTSIRCSRSNTASARPRTASPVTASTLS